MWPTGEPGSAGGGLPAGSADNQVLQWVAPSWIPRGFVALGNAPSAIGDVRFSDGFEIRYLSGANNIRALTGTGTTLVLGSDIAGANNTTLYLESSSNIYARIGGTVVVTLASAYSAFSVPIAITSGGSPATTGALRYANGQGPYWRNGAGTADIPGARVDISDQLQVGSSALVGAFHYVGGSAVGWRVVANGTTPIWVAGVGAVPQVGFFGTAPISKPTLTGSLAAMSAGAKSVGDVLVALGLASDGRTP